MDAELRKRLETFLRPLYQDLDGVSRLGEIERIATIARRLYTPPPEEADAFDLLLLFHGLGSWLEKIGNLSRAVLVTGLDDASLRRTAASIRRLDEPVSGAERAVAAALRIDSAGVRGLAERLSRARREGQTVMDVIREALADSFVPDWLPESGRAWLEKRYEARRQMCRQLLDELSLSD